MPTRTKIFSVTVLMFVVISMAGSRIDSLQITQAHLPGAAAAGSPARGGLAPAALLGSLGLAAAAAASGTSTKPPMKTKKKHPGHTMPVEPWSYPSNTRWEFLASVGKDMKLPIDAIITLSEMSLDSGRIQSSDYENLEKIYNSGVILSTLMNDIMEAARIGCESCGTVADEYDTPKLINDTISINTMHMSGKNVKFSLYIDASFPLRLKGDALKVKHIFNNILSNAFKFTPAGSVNWELYSEQDKKDGNAVWIVSKVRDTGVGISDENIGRILSGGGRIYPKTDVSMDGACLGLSITKRMVEMMHGGISVESRRGSGSVFTARFRQTLAGNETIGAERVRELSNFNYAEARRDKSRKVIRKFVPYANVLLVDSAESSLELMKDMLKSSKMRVDCVDSGQAALELVAAEDVKYDAILMEHMMPGMDGIETARLIRGIGTDYASNIPLIALSSEQAVANAETFHEKGFQAIVTKPVDATALNSVINHWVRENGRNGASMRRRYARGDARHPVLEAS